MKRRPLVLGIAGSPRRFGNSDRLLDAALKGAEAAGAVTERIVAAQANLRPCSGCGACALSGSCVERDGGPALYAALDRADGIIVASPVYFASVPAALKILYDRMQPYWARSHRLGQRPASRRPGAILLVRGGGDPYGFTGAEHTTRSAFAVLGIDVLGVVTVEGVDAAGDVLERSDALEAAAALGRDVAAAARGTVG